MITLNRYASSVASAARSLLSPVLFTFIFALFVPLVLHADVHTGTWSAKATLGGASYTQIYGIANVAQNTNYVASLWIKGSGTLTLVVNNPAWTYFPATTTVTATSTWTQVTLPAFNSSTNTQLVLRLYDNLGSSGGSVMYIDDGFLGVSGGSNLLGNPGFESGASNWTVGSAFAIGQFGTAGPPVPNGTYTLAPANASGLRLDVAGAATTNGTNVDAFTSNGGTNQQWIFTNVTGNVYRISPAHASAQCLDVSGQATASGTNVQTWTYLSQQNQNWALTAVSGGYTLTPQHATGLRLNNTGTASGSNVNVTTATSGTGQTWNVVAVTTAAETVGGGTIGNPAVGPAASFGLGSGATLVKNWNFGTNGTIKNISDMSANFMYHDQFGTIGNGTNYGAITVAPDAANAINDSHYGAQPVENGGSVPTVRSFTADSLKTFLVPLNGATTVDVNLHNAGNGSFVAKFALPNGGSLLNQDIIWETRVRYVTPPYFWFAIWNAGIQWHNGAEEDVVESFGYDNTPVGGGTNYDGRYWHSNSVGGTDSDGYSNWGNSMAAHGITTFDATQYHVWTWVYHKNNTYSVYVDGTQVNNGTINWTDGASAGGTPINVYFLFDAGWGHVGVSSVNHSMPASNFTGKYYEWDYSRVYLKP